MAFGSRFGHLRRVLWDSISGPNKWAPERAVRVGVWAGVYGPDGSSILKGTSQSWLVFLFIQMIEQQNHMVPEKPEKTIKDLVNTPFKKLMFGIQILSYILIVGSPAIGTIIGRTLNLKASHTGGLILGIFIAGEVLFYGSLLFLGKELVRLLRDIFKRWLRRKRKESSMQE